MKKVVSISLSILMLTAMLHISVAEHFCGGKETSTIISFTGKLANCGMEGSEKGLLLPGTYIKEHCCNDIVSSCGIGSYYSPEYSFVPESYQYNFQVLAIPVELSAKSQTDQNLLYTNVSPPGVLLSTNVDLSNICVFRI
jgi:hypothetical protein